MLGSGGPRSAGRAAASYLVAIEGTPRVLVDAGPGAFVRLGETGLSADALDTYLLTHFHVDHTGDVAGLVKSRDLFSDRPLRFRFYGPSGRGDYPGTSAFVARLFGPTGAFAYLRDFRNPLTLTPIDLPTEIGAAPYTVLNEDGVRISAVAVDHRDVPALAYRIERGGRSVVVTGDLASQRGSIVALARGASVLVYDAAVLDPPGSPAMLYALHTPPRRIGEVAAAAGVGTLILGHIPPALEQRQGDVIASVRESFGGSVRFAEDCLHIALDADRR